ncbi:MAG TPA: YihY/virulence factor BrkB family protein [Roseimicrobium sp.]|nr:YihY/virulence factor BrkB family protein [Roseimicrobium sp.]
MKLWPQACIATRLAVDAFKSWSRKDPFRESAVIAYYAIFSLPGLLLLVMTAAGYFLGQDTLSTHLHSQIVAAMGRDTADLVQGMLNSAGTGQDSVWATLIGLVTLLVGATGVFVQLQKSLNIIWEVRAVPSASGIREFIKARLFSFGLILSIAFLLLVSLVITSVLAAMSRWIESHWPGYIMFLFHVADFTLSFVIISVLFAMMFKYMPDAEVRWRYVWVGGSVTGLLFQVGKLGLGLYFGKAQPGSGYGAAGAVILILLWVSYSSMIFFYGAEFTKAFADHFHGEVAAAKNAVKDIGRES